MQSLSIPDCIRTAIFEHFDKNDSPIYVYEKNEIRSKCRLLLQIPYPRKKIHFATMANIHPEFLNIIRSEGIQVFVNSIPHMEQAQKSGYSKDEIIFTASSMNAAVMEKVAESGAIVNLDSLEQIALWNRVSGGKEFGIRCNMGHLIKPKKTRAGYFLGKASRLGLSVPEMRTLKGNSRVKGLHLYVGTDIMDIAHFMECYEKLGGFADWFPQLDYLDVGGGFGIDDNLASDFDFKTYGERVSSFMNAINERIGKNLTLILEPGRILGGKAGYFACKVVDTKRRQKQQLVGVNASVSQFPRPLFYPDTAVHPVAILDRTGTRKPEEEYASSIHGCSTYSRDFLARNVRLGGMSCGDIVVFGHAGSYCASSYTEFLGFPKPEEAFI